METFFLSCVVTLSVLDHGPELIEVFLKRLCQRKLLRKTLCDGIMNKDMIKSALA